MSAVVPFAPLIGAAASIIGAVAGLGGSKPSPPPPPTASSAPPSPTASTAEDVTANTDVQNAASDYADLKRRANAQQSNLISLGSDKALTISKSILGG